MSKVSFAAPQARLRHLTARAEAFWQALALRENRIWGAKERLFERILPKASDAALARLLQSAHTVDGIVKGLKAPEWPADGWQALQRLAMSLCGYCAAR